MIKYIILFFFTSNLFGIVNKKILVNNDQELTIHIEIDPSTDSDLFPSFFLVGLPNNELPITDVLFEKPEKIPFFSKIKKKIDPYVWINKQKIKNLETASLRICPLETDKTYFKSIIIKLKFSASTNLTRKSNANESTFLSNRVINWKVAQNWIIKKARLLNKKSNYRDGIWVSFFVSHDNVKKIDFSTLSAAIPELDQYDPRLFKMFMSYELGRSRTQALNLEVPENLVEVSIMVSGQDDGSFDEDDYILFYGRGPSGYDNKSQNLVWSQNLYFKQNKVWLFMPYDDLIPGKRIKEKQSPSNVDLVLDYGLSHQRIENDIINLEGSGIMWLDTPILSGSSISVQTTIYDPKNDFDINFSAGFKGNSSVNNQISTHVLTVRHPNLSGNKIGSTITWSGNGYRTINDLSAPIDLVNGYNYFSITNSSSNINSKPYLDYLELEYGRFLSTQLNYHFSCPIIGQNVRFVFSGDSYEKAILWDISQPNVPKKLNISIQGFADWENSNDSLGYFVLFNTDNIENVNNIQIEEPEGFNRLRNSELNANYLIIGPKEYRSLSSDLIEYRQPAIYADLETIYNEFSAGNLDPMAIRTFIQWTQENWEPPSPFAALLLGDSGYDYRDINGNSRIIVPTIQVAGSRSYATDDRLATIYGNIPEIALGRYPARNSSEVENFVNKIIAYETNPDLGPWRQKITLVADDASRPEPSHGSISTGKSHTLNSEELSNLIPSSILIDKIYMMEFPEVGDASAYGVIKPTATQAVFDILSSGTAIISYIGHGSPIQLAQEKLLYIDRGDINNINTGLKLPLWIVGTCSFGHFDDPLTESFAEELIREPLNAASMVISTTRAITVTGNERYTKDLFESMFPSNSVSPLPVGVLLQNIKNGNSESEYFHLFGDPMMKLPIPSQNVSINSISPDTLRALGIGSFFGNTNITSTESFGSVTLFDAERHVTRNYLINSQPESLSYILPGAALFRGQFSYHGNTFSGQIRVPQDISYSSQPAKMLIYIHDNTQDAIGSYEDISIIGGNTFTEDNSGPQISFENSNGSLIHSGDHIAENENLIVRISDPIGINVTNEIGHEIILSDLLSSVETNITNQFYYDYNSIMSGRIILPNFNGKSLHIEVKAWDNANNPNKESIKLDRYEKQKLKIYNAYNFPNPFTNSTKFMFEITEDARISLELFTLGGRRIKDFSYNNLKVGYNYIEWNGRNSFGDVIANGVYIYVIRATDSDQKSTFIGRCVKFK